MSTLKDIMHNNIKVDSYIVLWYFFHGPSLCRPKFGVLFYNRRKI